MRSIPIILACLMATAAMPLNATTPSDFSRAWAIVTPTTNTAYSIELPDEVALATRHNWEDAAVLDAADQPMQFTLSAPAMADVTSRSTPLKCGLQSDAQSSDATYRCTADATVSGAYGLRISRFAVWPATYPGELRVRNEKG